MNKSVLMTGTKSGMVGDPAVDDPGVPRVDPQARKRGATRGGA